MKQKESIKKINKKKASNTYFDVCRLTELMDLVYHASDRSTLLLLLHCPMVIYLILLCDGFEMETMIVSQSTHNLNLDETKKQNEMVRLDLIIFFIELEVLFDESTGLFSNLSSHL